MIGRKMVLLTLASALPAHEMVELMEVFDENVWRGRQWRGRQCSETIQLNDVARLYRLSSCCLPN